MRRPLLTPSCWYLQAGEVSRRKLRLTYELKERVSVPEPFSGWTRRWGKMDMICTCGLEGHHGAARGAGINDGKEMG